MGDKDFIFHFFLLLCTLKANCWFDTLPQIPYDALKIDISHFFISYYMLILRTLSPFSFLMPYPYFGLAYACCISLFTHSYSLLSAGGDRFTHAIFSKDFELALMLNVEMVNNQNV